MGTQVSDCYGISSGLIGTNFKIYPKSRAECGGVCLSSVPEPKVQRQEDCDFEAAIGTYRDPISKINKCTNKKPTTLTPSAASMNRKGKIKLAKMIFLEVLILGQAQGLLGFQAQVFKS